MFISVHIEINEHETSKNAHTISDAVESALLREMDAIATIHIDPVDLDNKALIPIKAYLDEIVSRYAEVKEYHDLRMVNKPGHKLILFVAHKLSG